MIHNCFYNGVLYQVEYKPRLSNRDYTKHLVYHISTDNENYPSSKKAIASIIEDICGYKQGYLWSKGDYVFKNTKTPNIMNALHPYYEFSFDEVLNKYVFVIVIPYDD